MAKRTRRTEQEQDQKRRRRARSMSAELANVQTGLATLAELPGGPIAAVGDGTIQAQAARLGDGRLQGAHRRALATQIGQIQGNDHLQRVIASQEWVGPSKRALLSTNASTLQRALPLPERDLPHLGAEPTQESVGEGERLPDPLTAVTRYRDSRSVDDGQRAVNEAVRYLELRGAVQYTGQEDIVGRRGRVRGTPEFSDVVSGEASEASGYTLRGSESGFAFIYSTDPLRYKVEIYPRAFIGGDANESLAYLLSTLVHEYIHIRQFRRQIQEEEPETERSNARREFQAWLWQAEHVTELGLRGNVQGIQEIYRNLRTYWRGLSDGDKRELESRVQDACRDNLGQDPAAFTAPRRR